MDETFFSADIACALEHWAPGIGDPTIMGWVTVAAYALCALMAGVVARRAPFARAGFRRERLFWAGLALLMGLLAVNKQLDLQSFLTALGRCDARLQGWYEIRRPVQRAFIILLLTFTVLGGAALAWVMRHALKRIWPALLGLVLVAGYVLVRAVSFHHMDALINTRLLDVRLKSVFELSGLVLILWGAWRMLRRAGP